MRTGDHVLHRPTGETWVVAFVDGDDLAWCGWPEGLAKTSDCELVEACDDAASSAILRDMLGMQNHGDIRYRWACAHADELRAS